MNQNSLRIAEFQKVLVANRGEIARRIFRTLREMGLETVAVFSDADRDAPHVAEADEAVRLGPAPSSASYLNEDAVLAAAKAVGADAIHPGYGFLAENAGFAARCSEEGLIFIGPSPEAIRRMGNKAEAKALAVQVGVPTLEGFEVDGLDEDEIGGKARALGYPLLIKAVVGGGGKGMRIVREPSELSAALGSAAREAASAFGDGSLLVERYLDSPRHVEIQVLGDAQGNLVHCFERDCSVQRRHQKVFEECPSPAVSPELRQRMGEAALALAWAVEYRGVGTVEFLLEASGEFFFLEMNTRLQVEHPVTEAVTGLDLVQLQVEIAQGMPLGFGQEGLALSGHAIEARLYAEDPQKDFLPATGTVSLWAVPEMPGLRIDSGVEQGVQVGIHYDPMLAKVIAHGRTRAEALERLHRGLAEFAVGGLVTNLEFLLAVLEHDAFRQGEVDTAFLEQHLPPAMRARPVAPKILELHAIAATLHLFRQQKGRLSPVPSGVPAGWRNNRWRPQEQNFEHAGEHFTVRYVSHERERFTFDVRLAGRDVEERAVWLVAVGDGAMVVEVAGVRRRFRIGSQGPGNDLAVHGLGRVTELTRVPRFPARQKVAVVGGCAAPMTGRVVRVLVAEGDTVAAGTSLVILEAMKMEHQIQAQVDGVVQRVHVAEGQMVDPDDVLVVVTPEGEKEGV